MIWEWIYRNVRVPKDSIVKLVDGLDADKDGWVTIGEIISAVKRLVKR